MQSAESKKRKTYEQPPIVVCCERERETEKIVEACILAESTIKYISPADDIV